MTKEYSGGVHIHAPLFICLIVGLAAVAAHAAGTSLIISSKGTDVSFTKVTPEAPFRIQASGPSTLILTFRQKLALPGSPGTPSGPGSAVILSIFMDGRKLGAYSLNLPRDAGAVCREEKDFIPSVSRTVRLKVPPGNHAYEVSMTGYGGAIKAERVPLEPLKTKGKELPSEKMASKRGAEEIFSSAPERIFGLSSSISMGYDSNILQLSPSDITLFRTARDYAPNNGLRRIDSNIASLDDFPIVLELVGTAQGRPWGKRRSAAEFKGHSYFYPRNTIKWYGDAGIAFKQDLSPGPEITLSYVFQTPTYLRNLSYFDPQAAGTSFTFQSYRKAWYTAHTGGISLVQAFSQIMTLEAGYIFTATIYRDVFRERDSYSHTGTGTIGARPWRPLGIRIGYAYESSLARGDIPSTLRTESDISYTQSSSMADIELDLNRLNWAKLLLKAHGGLGFKKFTTGNQADSVHYHRQDVINSLGGGIAYRVSKEWDMGISYAYTLVNSNANPTDREQGDEATSFREDVIFLTITFLSPPFGPSIVGE